MLVVEEVDYLVLYVVNVGPVAGDAGRIQFPETRERRGEEAHESMSRNCPLLLISVSAF